MNKLMLARNKTRKGAASIYIVVFATILFGVITTSFAKVIISEADQSSKDDLSQSAYDAALAGVEDAKTLVSAYYQCLRSGISAAICSTRNASGNNIFSTDPADCENGKSPLTPNGEVLIQSSSGSTGTDFDQAYTCVLISDTVPDYRSTLTTEARTKVVPLNIYASGSASGGMTNQISNVANIRLSWYSQLNQGTQAGGGFRTSNSLSFPDYENRPVPPTLQVQIIKAPADFKISDFHNENNVSSVVVNSTLVLMPSTSGTTSNISWNQVVTAGNVASGSTDNDSVKVNQPFGVSCSTETDYACTMRIGLSGISNTDNLLMVISLPYGDPFTDFSVALEASDGTTIDMKGVQISVDSTGRTNQLFRRVESRLDPSDLFFPYPQYAIELGASGEAAAFTKQMWVTTQCWTDQGNCNNGGDPVNNGMTSGGTFDDWWMY